MKKNAGFTLIEIMVVVAIIVLIAMIASVKFANSVQRSREASLKYNLAAIRSAISIYYSDTDGHFPAGPAGANETTIQDVLVPLYIKEIPISRVYPFHQASVVIDNVATADLLAEHPTDDGHWVYVSDSNDEHWGLFTTACYHADSAGRPWSSY